VLEVPAEVFPRADVFTILHDLAAVADSIKGHRITGSCLQKLLG